MRRSALYVGNDSGLMHLAAASGAPTLGLFGPTQDKLYAPWGDRTAVVRTPESFEDLIRDIGADHRTLGTRMDTLTVDAVENAARRLLAAVR
jgi:ADP-heptose:LPS heptosyltransferase